MKFVKLNSQGGIIGSDPMALEYEGEVHYHPEDAIYEALGWLRYVDAHMPEIDPGDGLQWLKRTADDGNGNCVVIWDAVAIPAPPEPGTSIFERFEALEAKVAVILEADDRRLGQLVDDAISIGVRPGDPIVKGKA